MQKKIKDPSRLGSFLFERNEIHNIIWVKIHIMWIRWGHLDGLRYFERLKCHWHDLHLSKNVRYNICMEHWFNCREIYLAISLLFSWWDKFARTTTPTIPANSRTTWINDFQCSHACVRLTICYADIRYNESFYLLLCSMFIHVCFS